ncbi:MAG: hypothetical protein IKV99_07100 [Oscillospiraceae bacterium]|nr:hypothetical protein [Oscillospiraceae bacterium]
MDERTVKNKIVAAMKEPPPPETLVESTVVRAKAVVMGRRAETRLESEETALPLGKRIELAAQSLIGRLAQVTALPVQVTPEAMAAQLAQQPRFAQVVESGNVLPRIRSGELLSATLQPAQRNAPAPERSGPERSGPSL